MIRIRIKMSNFPTYIFLNFIIAECRNACFRLNRRHKNLHQKKFDKIECSIRAGCGSRVRCTSYTLLVVTLYCLVKNHFKFLHLMVLFYSAFLSLFNSFCVNLCNKRIRRFLIWSCKIYWNNTGIYNYSPLKWFIPTAFNSKKCLHFFNLKKYGTINSVAIRNH